MTKKIRLGFVGANVRSQWASQSHFPALKASPDVEMTAVCNAAGLSAQAGGLGFPPASRFELADVCKPKAAGGTPLAPLAAGGLGVKRLASFRQRGEGLGVRGSFSPLALWERGRGEGTRGNNCR